MATIVDAHAHIGSWPTIKESERCVRESMKRYGVSFSLISDCDCSEYPSFERFPPHKVSQESGLIRTLRFVRGDPKRRGAAVWVNPHNETVTPRLCDLIAKNRKFIFALKVHPYESHLRVTSPKLKPYLKLAREFGLPILVHTAADRYSDVKYLGDLARGNPDLKFVAAHLQLCSDNEDGIKELARTANLYADTAWVDMKKAKRVLLSVGEDRIMFGTDNPIDGIDTLGNPMYRSYFKNRLRLPNRLYENLMFKNAIRLYRLPLKAE
ncbi:MAG: amidohydrolase [Bacilli bacterium]|jgi:predicted TIM-barrel fold metal-dependent hydrolase|nr:amidohydrolase [Bacilli bacterium]